MNEDNYNKLLSFFDELEFPLSPIAMSNLKEELDTDDRRVFVQTKGGINNVEYNACFMLVRPRYENYFAIREYQFTLDIDNGKIVQIFPVSYQDLFHPDRLKDPITKTVVYNLLNGRAVYFNEITRWSQMDFMRIDENGNFKIVYYHEKYEFDLERILGKYPIKKLDDAVHKSVLLDSLKMGNLEPVTFLENGEHLKKFIEANPQFCTLKIYDSNMNREARQVFQLPQNLEKYKLKERNKRSM